MNRLLSLSCSLVICVGGCLPAPAPTPAPDASVDDTSVGDAPIYDTSVGDVLADDASEDRADVPASAVDAPVIVSSRRWSRLLGGLGPNFARDVAVDARGDVYLVGLFASGTDLGGGVHAGDHAFALVALAPDGTYRWHRSFGSESQPAPCVAVDASGNVYVGGTFERLAAFEDTPAAPTGAHDLFLMSYTSSGAPRWTRRFGTGDDETLASLSVNAAGEVFITGTFTSGLDLGAGALPSFGDRFPKPFHAMFTSAGVARWSSVGDAVNPQRLRLGAIDDAGNSYVAGVFAGSVSLGGASVTSAGGDDVLLVSYDPRGVVRWAQRFGASANETPTHLFANRTGELSMLVTAAPSRGAVTGFTDHRLVRFDPRGTQRWVAAFEPDVRPAASAIADDGRVFVTGGITGLRDHGYGVSEPAAGGGSDVVIASWNADGGARGSRRYASDLLEGGVSIVATEGALLVVGQAQGAIDFGYGAQTPRGIFAAFVASLEP
jgi:hypothetical protein